MKPRYLLGALLILAAAGSLVAWREANRPATPTPKPAASGAPRVVLFVDLSEVDEKEGCGAIIHAVRAAAKRGLATEEIDAREPGEAAKRYRLLIAPAVVVLDAEAREARRFEGESPATVMAIKAELERLAPAR